MIEAWRGLAALGVVCHHLHYGARFNLGHICVMVFFVISGYCIAASTASCQRNRLPFSSYMWRRIRRIYPPYFFATCLFLSTRIVKLVVEHKNELATSGLVWLQNLTITQWLSLVRHPSSYSATNSVLFVPAYWSLNYEEQFYIVMGLLLLVAVRLRVPILLGTSLIAVPALIFNIYRPSISYGFFLEYWVHFAIGVVVFYRLCIPRARWKNLLIDCGLVALIALSFRNWPTSDFTQFRSVYIEWTVAAVFALAIIYLRRWDEFFKNSIAGRSLCAFGLITYSLYLTHEYNTHLAVAASGWGLRHSMPAVLKAPLEIGMLVLLGTAFWYLCERPFLNKPLRESTAPNHRLRSQT
jgi:peptidoglycan/LPS O-acetylase OafA/YrhL